MVHIQSISVQALPMSTCLYHAKVKREPHPHAYFTRFGRSRTVLQGSLQSTAAGITVRASKINATQRTQSTLCAPETRNKLIQLHRTADSRFARTFGHTTCVALRPCEAQIYPDWQCKIYCLFAAFLKLYDSQVKHTKLCETYLTSLQRQSQQMAQRSSLRINKQDAA